MNLLHSAWQQIHKQGYSLTSTSWYGCFLVASENMDCRINVFVSFFLSFIRFQVLCEPQVLLRCEVVWPGDRRHNSGITNHAKMYRRSSIRVVGRELNSFKRFHGLPSLPQLITLRSLMGRTTRLATFLSPLLHIILHENRCSYLNIIPYQRSIRTSSTSHICALSIVCRATSTHIRSSKSSESRNLPQQMSAIIGS